MHPLSLRRILLKRLPLILSLQALGVRVPTVWVLCVDDGNGNYVPRPDYPVCMDEDIAEATAKVLTARSKQKHVPVAFKSQTGGLLG